MDNVLLKPEAATAVDAGVSFDLARCLCSQLSIESPSASAPASRADAAGGVVLQQCPGVGPGGQDVICGTAENVQPTANAAAAPSFTADDAGLRPIVIDGSNIAMSHGSKDVFSCRGIQLAVDWFRQRGHQEITVFVPQWRRESHKQESVVSDRQILSELERVGVLVFTPSRKLNGKRITCYDDRYIVKLAAETDGVIVSNDTYRDLAAESADFRKVVEERLLMYSFVNDRFMPPDDPLGRRGPSLDEFLRKESLQSALETPRAPPCPYGKKCTYGAKCRFYHADRSATNRRPQRTAGTGSKTSPAKLKSGAMQRRSYDRDYSASHHLGIRPVLSAPLSSDEQRFSESITRQRLGGLGLLTSATSTFQPTYPQGDTHCQQYASQSAPHDPALYSGYALAAASRPKISLAESQRQRSYDKQYSESHHIGVQPFHSYGDQPSSLTQVQKPLDAYRPELYPTHQQSFELSHDVLRPVHSDPVFPCSSPPSDTHCGHLALAKQLSHEYKLKPHANSSKLGDSQSGNLATPSIVSVSDALSNYGLQECMETVNPNARRKLSRQLALQGNEDRSALVGCTVRSPSSEQQLMVSSELPLHLQSLRQADCGSTVPLSVAASRPSLPDVWPMTSQTNAELQRQRPADRSWSHAHVAQSQNSLLLSRLAHQNYPHTGAVPPVKLQPRVATMPLFDAQQHSIDRPQPSATPRVTNSVTNPHFVPALRPAYVFLPQPHH